MKKTILAVDDVKSILTIIYYVFGEKYHVEKKENGKEALEWMQKGNIPDLIITDVKMPEMDGFEFLTQLKSSSFYNDIPVVVLSSMNDSAEKIKFLRLGANDYMVKPFNPEELDARVANLLSFTEKSYV
jgi:two-component system, chemotaxis family, chemotaxis protein CheY